LRQENKILRSNDHPQTNQPAHEGRSRSPHIPNSEAKPEKCYTARMKQ
jgi:hypothetical protein